MAKKKSNPKPQNRRTTLDKLNRIAGWAALLLTLLLGGITLAQGGSADVMWGDVKVHLQPRPAQEVPPPSSLPL